MNRNDYAFALSEREQISNLLKNTPKDHAISRKSLEDRLEKVESIIAHADVREHQPTHAVLTFRGPTVVGTHGISAVFGTKAISCFNDAIAYLASSFQGPLPASGRIPNMENNHLMITSSARGSFGFVLEEFRPDAPLGFDEETPVSKAVDKTREILQASLDHDDEELSDAIENLDSRALDKIRGFIHYLFENKTVFTLKTSDFNIVFREPKQLEYAYKRLSNDNIQQEKITEKVIFLGTLPNKRQCEFIVLGNTDIRTANIDKAVDDPDVINKHLGSVATAVFLTKTVGNGKPRYTLLSQPEWDVKAKE
ncbi:hypothetical protein RRO28_001568 [Salmonella enterica]|uniref:Uncharacterized protein n=4 Tax=Salmonella enterica TaxID=28901 RepID=A0A5T7QF38_SALER|nr:hypothetical protein [Salmonella enterica]EBQ9962213.1 hypothetical protein [Salmonella enterica subsp. enterica serovar Bareilly]ECD1868155.1 hypothetical protein [Salmonella enterica subsp. enterica serovar Chester]EDE4791893.1 hypothetical protein [Salmonella enterica subsp. enterica serovar Enteritidis]EED6996752.1 hypothetical protein [Salmonella enterica subsp. enterica serovar Virchow]EEM6164960.1 hypothetical protein [Salmonella enterica subsp. enterica serovar Brazzaville]EHQ72494